MENIVLKFEYSEITPFHRYKQQSVQKHLVTIATQKIEFLGIKLLENVQYTKKSFNSLPRETKALNKWKSIG